jgi:1A family penicillin-binding protein
MSHDASDDVSHEDATRARWRFLHRFGRDPRRRFPFVPAAAAVAVFAASAAASAWELSQIHFPSPAEITARRVIVLQSADGHDLPAGGTVQLPPVAANRSGGAMGANVVNAVLSIEDKRFYRHGGIDLLSILRAAMQNIEADRVVAGGSTITQQLVKMLFLGPERTYARKLKEAVIAIWLEQHLSKDEILTSYLNNVYLGSGAIGFPAAAKIYFGKDVGELNVAEAAMLAGLINAPSHDDPLHDLAAARSRAAIVLDAMVADGNLSPQDALLAKLHPATPSRSEPAPASAGWFADWIYRKVADATSPLSGTVRIRTTLDLRLQQIAADVVKSALAQYGQQKHATQAALIAMRPDGAVVAMIGGRSYGDSQFNRAVQAQRQPGSSFKLFDYYAALRQGYSPDSEIDDAPVDVKGWEPENYGHRYHGRVQLAEAFAQSLNAATVRLSQQVGIDEVIAAAHDLGLRAQLPRLPSIALGTADVTLIDLTSTYDAVRAGVAPIEPYGIAGIQTASNDHYVQVGRPDVKQHALGPYRDTLITLLRGVIEHGTGRAAALPGFVAGKTGTAQDYRDAWFIGFDNALTVGVWVGNDDHSPMNRVVGGSIPAMIWKNFMQQVEATATVASTSQPPAPITSDNTPTAGATETPSATAASTEAPEASGRPATDRTPVLTAKQEPRRGALFNQSTAASEPFWPAGASSCNIPVCSQFYHSFRASDCTYQPYDGGPRRVCER